MKSTLVKLLVLALLGLGAAFLSRQYLLSSFFQQEKEVVLKKKKYSPFRINPALQKKRRLVQKMLQKKRSLRVKRTCSIHLSIVKKMFARLQFDRNTRMFPYALRGIIVGYRLQFRKEPLFVKLGLKSGDVLLTVQGKSVVPKSGPIELYAKLTPVIQAGALLKVGILRGKRKLLYSCRLKK